MQASGLEQLFYLASVGYCASFHACHPPFRALTFLNPLSNNIRAARALVASSCQAQYAIISFSAGNSLDLAAI
jgi:hypothetical protein